MSENKENTLSRRQFIKNTSAAVGSSLLLGGSAEQSSLFAENTGKTGAKTKVIMVRDKNALDKNGKPRYEVVLEMLDKAVCTLLDNKDPVDAWKKIIKPADIVGIKTNVCHPNATPPQVEKALKKRVMDAGVKDSKIIIKDRGAWADDFFFKTTALVNVRPMRSHHWSGVGSLIKNYITFDKKPSSYHGDSCADLAKLWFLPICKGKTRLNVLLMLTPQFHSTGPHSFHPKYVWQYNGLIASIDPVAADSVGLRILQAKRKDYFGEDRPLNPPAKHIALADTRHSLGTADPNKIELVKLGDDEGILI